MDSHIHQPVVILVGSLWAIWGVSLSILSILVSVILPSLFQSRMPMRVPVSRKRGATSLPGRGGHKHKRNSSGSTSPQSSLRRRRDRYSLDLPISAIHPRTLSIKSEASSMHTTSSTEESFFTSTTTSSENVHHHRRFSLKRAWHKAPRSSSPSSVHFRETAPRSSYSRIVSKTKKWFKPSGSSGLHFAQEEISSPASLHHALEFGARAGPADQLTLARESLALARCNSLPLPVDVRPRVKQKKRWKRPVPYMFMTPATTSNDLML